MRFQCTLLRLWTGYYRTIVSLLERHALVDSIMQQAPYPRKRPLSIMAGRCAKGTASRRSYITMMIHFAAHQGCQIRASRRPLPTSPSLEHWVADHTVLPSAGVACSYIMVIVAFFEADDTPFAPSANSRTDTKITILEDISDALQTSSDADHRRKKHRSLLLALPAELRTAIYTAALLDNDNDTSLLRTCKQIYMAASPTLYQRPASFSSQASLTSWVERSQEADLKRVRTLSLELTDIDMSSLIDNDLERTSPRPTAWSLHQRELEKLDRALRSLSGLRNLSITPPEKIHSQLMKAMYLSFLAMISTRLPSLAELTIHDDESSMNKVPSLKMFSSRAKLVFDTVKRPRHVGSSSSEASTDLEKMADDVVMVDGVAIKIESMDTD